MRKLKDFKKLTEVYGEEIEVYVETPNGEIEEIVDFIPTKDKKGLIIKLPHIINFKD